MPRRNWKTVSTDVILDRIRQAALTTSDELEQLRENPTEEDLEELDVRIHRLLSFANNPTRKSTNMTYLVMYDIESNKVRTLVAKYLIAEGCIRIQNSIFIADTTPDRCDRIKRDLADVQASYANQDSILVVPLTATNVQAMHIIGRTLDLDLVMKNRSTLFF